MPKSFGIEAHPKHGKSVFFSLLTFVMLLSPVSVLLELLRIAFIRHIEFKADKFATNLGYGVSIYEALCQSYRKNSDAF